MISIDLKRFTHTAVMAWTRKLLSSVTIAPGSLLDVSADASLVLILRDKRVYIVRTADGTVQGSIPFGVGAKFSMGGGFVVDRAFPMPQIMLYRCSDGASAARLNRFSSAITSFVASETRVFGSDMQGTVTSLNWKSGAFQSYERFEDPVRELQVLDEDHLMGIQNARLQIWDVATGHCKAHYNAEMLIESIQPVVDGRLVLRGRIRSDPYTEIVDVATWKRVGTFQGTIQGMIDRSTMLLESGRLWNCVDRCFEDLESFSSKVVIARGTKVVTLDASTLCCYALEKREAAAPAAATPAEPAAATPAEPAAATPAEPAAAAAAASSGVLLGEIRGLCERYNEQKVELEAAKTEIASLKRHLAELEARNHGLEEDLAKACDVHAQELNARFRALPELHAALAEIWKMTD